MQRQRVIRKHLTRLARKIRMIVFDFDGVFTNNKVIVNEKGEESVVCNRADGIGLSKLKQLGTDLLILSTEPNDVVRQRARKLKIRCVDSCKDKLKRLLIEVKKRNLSFNKVAYVGNDINDIDCLRIVGFPIVVGDAHKDVIRYGKYKTRLRGGSGAVREVCDLIYTAKIGGRSNVRPL